MYKAILDLMHHYLDFDQGLHLVPLLRTYRLNMLKACNMESDEKGNMLHLLAFEDIHRV